MAFNDAETVKSLASLMDEYKLSEIEYGQGDMHIRLSRHAAPVMTACAPAAAPTPAQTQEAREESAVDEKNVVRSPMLGIVYTAPEPDAEPYVKVGESDAVFDRSDENVQSRQSDTRGQSGENSGNRPKRRRIRRRSADFGMSDV